MLNEEIKVKEWYVSTYPEDEVGATLNEETTFNDVFVALDTHEDVYEVIGGDCDSIVRERVFEKLATIMNVEYDYIYNQWLDA
jgi:hypothetical protein